jgi:hypothetical protein
VIVTGIDLGTSCGWALRDSEFEGVVNWFSGVWDLSIRPNEGEGMRWVRLSKHLREFDAVDLIAYEAVARHKGTRAAHVYGGIRGQIEYFAEKYKINYVGIPVGTWKKAAGCKGNCSGETALRAAEARWPDHTFATDDEAAARWIAECAHTTYAETRGDG